MIIELSMMLETQEPSMIAEIQELNMIIIIGTQELIMRVETLDQVPIIPELNQTTEPTLHIRTDRTTHLIMMNLLSIPHLSSQSQSQCTAQLGKIQHGTITTMIFMINMTIKLISTLFHTRLFTILAKVARNLQSFAREL